MTKDDFLKKYEEVMGVRLTKRGLLLGLAMTLGLIVMCLLGEFLDYQSFR